jgi:UDP-N-acetylmuramoylalanine--D-glutamate ligase
MDLPDLKGWRILVIGLGISGRSAAAWCADRGADVVAADERPEAQLEPLGDLARRAGAIALVTGQPLPDPADFDLVVPSPGVPRDRYRDRARRVWGDVELAGRALPIPIVAVTGTNGKSTTVRLLETMLQAAGYRARAAGNIGSPALSLVGEPLDVAVLEVSSFQLETVEDFRPRVAVILNLTADHLDRHGRFEDYVDAKARILARQQPDDVAVLNFDDPVVRRLADRTRARIVPVSRRGPLDHGVFLDSGRVRLRDGATGRNLDLDLEPASLPGLPGVHNLENVLAALAAVWGLGAPLDKASRALVSFAGLPHRCQEVARGRGIAFVDDSKATNPGAAQRSLESFSSALIWIAGGRAKGADFDELAKTAAQHAERVVLIGEAADEIERALAGRLPVTRCESIEEAVSCAAEAARPGGVVLLAPACASFDQFSSFEERGERFSTAARQWLALGGTT